MSVEVRNIYSFSRMELFGIIAQMHMILQANDDTAFDVEETLFDVGCQAFNIVDKAGMVEVKLIKE